MPAHSCACNFKPTGSRQIDGVTYVVGKKSNGEDIEVPLVDMCAHMQAHIADLLDREQSLRDLLESLVRTIYRLEYRLGQAETAGRR